LGQEEQDWNTRGPSKGKVGMLMLTVGLGSTLIHGHSSPTSGVFFILFLNPFLVSFLLYFVVLSFTLHFVKCL